MTSDETAGRAPRRAWRTKAIGIESIVSAHTRGQAKTRTVLSARGAGYAVSYWDVTARRAPEFDAWARTVPLHAGCRSEESVRQEIAASPAPEAKP